MRLTKNSKQRIITGLALVASLYLLLYYFPPLLFSILLSIALFIMLIELKKMFLNSKQFYALAPFYPIIPCLILIYFNQSSIYKKLLIYLFIIVFSFDTACYIIGKLCHKFWTTKKIVPHISPGKSIEGFFGGYFVTTWIIFFIAQHNFINSDWHLYSISAMICIIAFVGDIFESYLKRSAKIKDSGTILPGHGGMLDRFDAILAVSYFFFIFKNYLIQIF